MVERITSSYTMRGDLKETAEKAIKDGDFPGVTNLSGLIELGLVEILKSKGLTIPKPEA